MKTFLLTLIILTSVSAYSQPADILFETVIPSTHEAGHEQPAFAIKNSNSLPITVWGHGWAGSYLTYQNVNPQGVYNFNNSSYVFPHFRGPGYTRDAGGSRRSTRDIRDAVNYGINNFPNNGQKIYIGRSGGGMHGLMTAIRHDPFDIYLIAVPVININNWYKNFDPTGVVATGLREMCGGDPTIRGTEAFDRCRRRSPIDKLSPEITVPIDWHIGLNDVTVPAWPSLKAFNQLVGQEVFPQDIINYVKANNDLPESFKRPRGVCNNNSSNILYRRTFGNKRIVITDGGHEVACQNLWQQFLERHGFRY